MISASLKQALGTLKVQARSCSTCIYRKDWHGTPVKELEAQVADGYGGFVGSRICHHSHDVTCRGFWNRNRDKFAAGQIAQRLGCVEFVEVDINPLASGKEQTA
jgi:hypothetical protein